jgi:tRNA G18 (ribose-2'-O)-methylase SpoU
MARSETIDPRGYFGIGIYAGKTPDNLGGLWRSAHAFGADYLFTIGARYPQQRQPTDTTDATRHVPLFEFDDWIAFREAAPFAADIVGVEIDDRARDLTVFCHPERAVYVLGAEDRGLSEDAVRGCDSIVAIPSSLCLNVATAGSIVLYDRKAKQ